MDQSRRLNDNLMPEQNKNLQVGQLHMGQTAHSGS